MPIPHKTLHGAGPPICRHASPCPGIPCKLPKSLVLLLPAFLMFFFAGCTRNFFRNDADQEVSAILREKNEHLTWPLENHYIYPHPAARFADPTNPDRPPMPPDDPDAWRLAPRPQRPKKIAYVEGTGYLDLLTLWDLENRERLRQSTEQLPAPRPLPTTPAPAEATTHGMARWSVGETPFLITLEQAVELGSLNSREFQDRREDLYLAALPVTFERFNFAAQFAAINQTIREWAGSESPVGQQNRWLVGSTVGLRKFFATGALLLVQLTNDTVINLAGAQPRTLSQSVLELDLVQPLLQGAGKTVALEPLTLAERNLLYEMRDLARFHKLFFVSVAGGTGEIPGIGYLPTLLTLSRLRNEMKNEEAFGQTLKYFQALAGGGSISKLQVDQIELAYLAARSTVLQRKQDFAFALDRFKLQLGVPTNLPLEIDDSTLEPLFAQTQRYESLQESYTTTLTKLQELKQLKPKELRPGLKQFIQDAIVLQGIPLQAQILTSWEAWEKLAKGHEGRIDELVKTRRKLQEQITILEAEQKPVTTELRKKLFDTNLEIDLGSLEVMLRSYEAGKGEFQRIVDRLGVVLAQGRVEQMAALARRWPGLPPVYLHGQNLLDEAKKAEPMVQTIVGQTALANRLDLQNERARVADAWRGIGFSANSLLGTFDVGYNLKASTPPGAAKPLAFATSRTQQQLRFNTSLPLVRKLERNIYRQSLIDFQRQRRTLMAAEDQIVLDVRQHLRRLQQLTENYEIQRRVVELAYLQVTLALETFRAPPAPNEQRDAATAAAALTQQLLNAQRAVPQAQNDLFAIWVDYITTRMAFYRDLELMRVDTRGVWIDEYASPDLLVLPDVGTADEAFTADLRRQR